MTILGLLDRKNLQLKLTKLGCTQWMCSTKLEILLRGQSLWRNVETKYCW